MTVLNVISGLQNLYFTRFFDILGCQHLIITAKKKSVLISFRIFFRIASQHIYTTKQTIACGYITVDKYGIETGDVDNLGMENPLRQIRINQ